MNIIEWIVERRFAESFQAQPAVWDLVESDSGNCLGRGCPDYAKCFYFQARKRMFGANLLIVNHALFFSDLALRREGASLLPDYKVVVFDEAHIVLLQIDGERGEGREIQVKDIRRRWLEQHLKLVMLMQPVWIFAVATILRPPRRLHATRQALHQGTCG